MGKNRPQAGILEINRVEADYATLFKATWQCGNEIAAYAVRYAVNIYAQAKR